MLCSGISSFSWHVVFRIRESHFPWTNEMTSREKWLKFPGSCEWDVFLRVPSKQLSWGRKPKKVRAFSPSISPGWSWSTFSFSGLEGTQLSLADGRHYLTPHLMNRFAPRGWNCPRVYYEISFALHESVQESRENKIWKMKNGKRGPSLRATRLNQVCPETALTWQVISIVILHFCDGEGF